MSRYSDTLKNITARLRDRWRLGAIGAASTVFIGLLFLMSATLGRGFNKLSYDFPFLVRAALPMFQPPVPTNEVVIVYMDDRSHRELKQPGLQAWDREMHARLIGVLAAHHAKAVVIDVLFDTPGTNDAKLIPAAASYGKVLLGAVLESQSHEGKILGYHPVPPHAELKKVVTWGLVEAAGADRIIREHYRGNEMIPTLAWKTAELTKVDPLPAAFVPRWVNYYGPPGALPSRSFVDVLNTNFPPAVFSNKVVFVGALYRVGYTAGKGTDDFRTPYTPWTQTKSPGVEINATTFLNLARHDWVTELLPITQFILVLALGLFLGFGLVLLRPTTATLFASGTILLVIAAGCLLSWRQLIWFPWATIAGLQIPVALACSVLSNTRQLYRDKDVLEEQLAAASRKAVLQPLGALSKTAVVPEGAPIRKLGPPIPNHEMLRCIGKGAYGEVWLARDEIGSYHAVKIVYRHSFQDSGPFDREFRGIQQYTPMSRSHPGLVHILHVGRNMDAGYFFYIMELGDCEVNGTQVIPEAYRAKNLARELDRDRTLPVKDCIDLGIGLAEALQYLHSRQLIHRDIKPSNIIFVNGIPKFADVGLVTHIAEKGRNVTYLGTEGFIAPEGPGTPAADVFSLGKVLYEAAMGRAAAQFPDLPTTLTRRTDQNELLMLNEMILKACQPDHNSRYQTAGDLQADLMRLKESLYNAI
jgi:CHASE2 domain-containing sensor protein